MSEQPNRDKNLEDTDPGFPGVNRRTAKPRWGWRKLVLLAVSTALGALFAIGEHRAVCAVAQLLGEPGHESCQVAE